MISLFPPQAALCGLALPLSLTKTTWELIQLIHQAQKEGFFQLFASTLVVFCCVTSGSCTCGLTKAETVSVWDSGSTHPGASWGWLGAHHLPSAANKPLDLPSPPQTAPNSRELQLFCCELRESILIGNIDVTVSLPQLQST